jgi:hypothetical protein
MRLRINRLDTESYATPVAVSQRPGSTPLGDATVSPLQQMDGDDQRLQQVTLRKGRLWTSLGTSVHSDGAPLRSGAAYFAIDVKTSATGLQSAVHRQGYVAARSNQFLTYPAVGVTAGGKVAMVFTVAGLGEFPSAGMWRLGGTTIHIVSEGTDPEDGFSAYFFARPRWGDYSATAVDRDGSIWIATEYIPGPRDFYTNWGTFVAHTSADDEGEDDD